MNAYLSARVILLFGSSLWCQYSEIFFKFFQNVSNPDLYSSPAEGFFQVSMGAWSPSTLVVTDSTMPVDLPVSVAPTPSLLLILTCLIVLFTGELVLAIHSAEEWSSIHIHNVTNMNGALHSGMRLKSPFHKLEIPGKDSRNARNNVKIRETYEVMA